MTPEQQAAYINSQVACALIEMEGMKAANAISPLFPPYSEADFKALIERYGIHHNGVLGCMGR